MKASPSAPASTAEVLIIPPEHDGQDEVATFVRRCIVAGIDFHFEADDRLPVSVPVGVSGVRAIFVDASRIAAEQSKLDAYRAKGATFYRMRVDSDPSLPNSTQSWMSPRMLHMATVDAGLTVPSENLRRKLLARDEAVLFRRLADQLNRWQAAYWYDTTCYNWEMMLDVSELTGDAHYADTAYEQMRRLMRDVPNHVGNCDTIAPFRPMLRVAHERQDAKIIAFVREHVDRYLEATPRYRGCLVNFVEYPNNARAEILWQVLPSLMALGRVVDERSYTEVAWEQYERLHSLLYDPARKLWRHGIGPAGPTTVFWSRLLGFTLLANLMLLELTDEREPVHSLMLRTFRDGCSTLPRFQRPDGFFNSIVDEPFPSPESSGPAWIGAAVTRGRRLGYLGPELDEVAERAAEAVRTRVWDGDYPGHMTATTVSHVPGYYHRMPLSDTGWPQFPLRLMCERLRARSVASAGAA